MPVLFWQWLGTRPIGEVLALQHTFFRRIACGQEGNMLILCEHTPCFTYTREPFSESLRIPKETFEKMSIPALRVLRGGGTAFHGPGQITAYFILELSDIALNFVSLGYMFECIARDTLAHFDIPTTPTSTHPDVAKNFSARGAWADGKRKIM